MQEMNTTFTFSNGSVFNDNFYNIAQAYNATKFLVFIVVFVIFTVNMFKYYASMKDPWSQHLSDKLAEKRVDQMNKASMYIILTASALLSVVTLIFIHEGSNSNITGLVSRWVAWGGETADMIYIHRGDQFMTLLYVLGASTMYSNNVHLLLQKQVTTFFHRTIYRYDTKSNADAKWSLRVNCIVEVTKFIVAFLFLSYRVNQMVKSFYGGICAFVFLFFYYEILHIWNVVSMICLANFDTAVKKVLNISLPLMVTYVAMHYKS